MPSTYDECHAGPDHTWIAPSGSAVSRIDYILIPTSWDVPVAGSTVLHQVDFGQAGLDYFAVCLDTSVGFAGRLPPRSKSRHIDVANACSPEAVTAVQEICDTAPQVGWEVDAHCHYHLVSEHILTRLAERFPRPKASRRRTFFSDTTWMFRQQRLWLRKQAHLASDVLTWWLPHCAVRSWTSGVPLHRGLVTGLAALLRAIFDLRQAILDLRKLKPQFRSSLRSDKRRHLSEVATLAMNSPTRDVVSKLRPLLGPPKRRQRGVAPLPALELEDGSLGSMAATPAEADARWLRHFSSIERGGPVSPEDFVARCIQRQRAADLEMFEVEQADLPSKFDLEHAMRQAKLGRACGNDGFPADVLHGHSGAMAALFYPVLLKTAYRFQEPIQFKGGTVKHIWKQKGAHEICSSHRGILFRALSAKPCTLRSALVAARGWIVQRRRFK